MPSGAEEDGKKDEAYSKKGLHSSFLCVVCGFAVPSFGMRV
jgi:hypothetical protein